MSYLCLTFCGAACLLQEEEREEQEGDEGQVVEAEEKEELGHGVCGEEAAQNIAPWVKKETDCT